jgi:hypothetical protein
MKLSSETIAILKNFSGINQNLEFKQGNKLSTISTTKAVWAQANIKDDFPKSFCVYDLNKFLASHAMFKDSAEMTFESDNRVTMSSGRRRYIFTPAARDAILTPPDKDIKMDKVDCSFIMSADDYADIMKAVNVLSSPNISVVSDGDKVSLVAGDTKDDALDKMLIEVGEGNGHAYKIVFKTENFKMLQGDYQVEISFKGFARFQNTKDDIQYFVAFEGTESTY